MTCNYGFSAHTKEARLNEPSQVETTSQHQVASLASQANKQIHLWPNGRSNISIAKHFSFLHQKLPLSRSSSISSNPLYICLTNLKSQIRNSKSFILNQYFLSSRRNSHLDLKRTSILSLPLEFTPSASANLLKLSLKCESTLSYFSARGNTQ